MTRKSKRELERMIEDLEPADGLPEEPPHDWMAPLPRELWDDPVEALRYYSKQAGAHEDENEAEAAQ